MAELAEKPRKRIGPLGIVLALSGVFFAVFLAVSGLYYLASSPGASKSGGHAGFFKGGGAIGVVEITGVIMDSKKVLKQLERFDESSDIKAIVLRLNSPGGAVAPSQEIYEAVRQIKKPVVASMSSVAASGAYYIACGARKIFANAGTLTGSIGVIMEFANLAKLYDWAKIERYAIKTGKYKDAGAEYREMSPEERALLQNLIDNVLDQFKTAVSKGRKMTMAEVTKVADGRIFSGAQALNAHLIDEVGTFRDATDEAAELAGIKGKPEIVYPSPSHRSLLDVFLDDFGHRDDDSDESSESSTRAPGILSALTGTLNSVARATSLPEGIYWLWRAQP